MKKNLIRFVSALTLVALLCAALAGCSSSSKAKDGTYTARFRDASHDYVEFLTVTFEGGKPTSAQYDAYLESDPTKLKSTLTADEYPMDPLPADWMPELSKNVVAAGDNPDKIATVAGATNSSKSARILYNAILSAAAKGDTTEIVVDNPTDAE